MKNPPNLPEKTASDGCQAIASVELLATSAAAAFPITPTSAMAAIYQRHLANGQKNAWGGSLSFFEAESEHSSASICEGYALAGGRIVNFTSGQGLILMKEVLYVIAGKRLPVVFHIGARTLSVQSLSIHCGHDDIMGVTDCGWGILFATNVQQAADFALIARKTAEDALTPFFNVQDGFYTTHTVEYVTLPDAELVRSYLNPPDEALTNLFDVKNPLMTGVVQGQETYMISKIAQREYYRTLKEKLIANMDAYYALTGRQYKLIDCHYMEGADYAIVGMGSFMETAQATIETLNGNSPNKVGVVIVHAFRPFPGPELVEALKNVKVISVLERMDDFNSPENPLSRAIKAAFSDASWGHPDYTKINNTPVFQQGAAGLSGLEVTMEDFLGLIDNMKQAEKGKLHYCLGVNHPDALEKKAGTPIHPSNYFALRGYSVAGLGGITTNKILASLCSELFKLNVQAYPKYGAEKKGLPTRFFLALSSEHIKTHRELIIVNCVVINDPTMLHRQNPLDGLLENGVVFLKTTSNDPLDIWSLIPSHLKKIIRDKHLKLYGLDVATIAQKRASSPALAIRMQGILFVGAFLRITPLLKKYKISEKKCFEILPRILKKYFGDKGKKILDDNIACIREGFDEVVEVSEAVMKKGK